MTPEELREVDRKVAEAIGEDWAWAASPKQIHCNREHGISERTCRDCGWEFTEEDFEQGVPRHFTTDPASAWRLLEYWAMKRKGRRPIFIWANEEHGFMFKVDTLIGADCDKNSMLALSLAFLKAKEKK